MAKPKLFLGGICGNDHKLTEENFRVSVNPKSSVRYWCNDCKTMMRKKYLQQIQTEEELFKQRMASNAFKEFT